MSASGPRVVRHHFLLSCFAFSPKKSQALHDALLLLLLPPHRPTHTVLLLQGCGGQQRVRYRGRAATPVTSTPTTAAARGCRARQVVQHRQPLTPPWWTGGLQQARRRRGGACPGQARRRGSERRAVPRDGWPGGARAAGCASHPIDSVEKYGYVYRRDLTTITPTGIHLVYVKAR